MKYLLFLAIVSAVLRANGVEATVNTQEVIKGNPVQLRLRATGGAAAFPNIHDIDGSLVTNSGTSRQNSMQITINGMEQKSSTIRKYIFVPKKSMIIPSYNVRIGGKTYKTKPISIKVIESHSPKVQNNDTFSFVLKCDKTSVYVGESFVVTVYISVSERLRGVQIANFVAPTAADFFIKEIEGQKEYQNNGYSIIEKNYIFTTKKEGNFTVSPAAAKLGQPDRSVQDIFGRYGMSWTNVVSNDLNIEVKALQSDAELIGDFSIEVVIDAQKVKPNKPVNLTVKINGKGNLEDFELSKYDINGVTIYSDEAKIESQIKGKELLSSYSKSFAFIAEDDFVISERNITMYDPQTKETKILVIPKYSIMIEGKKIVATTTLSSSSTSNSTRTVESETTMKKIEVKIVAWWMLLLAFLLGMLSMYLLRFIPKIFGNKEHPYKESDALKLLYAHISEGADVEEMVRKLYAKKNGNKSVRIDKKELKLMIERFR